MQSLRLLFLNIYRYEVATSGETETIEEDSHCRMRLKLQTTVLL